MDEKHARAILGEAIREDGKLTSFADCYVDADCNGKVLLDGWLTYDELDAIAWWLRNK